MKKQITLLGWIIILGCTFVVWEMVPWSQILDTGTQLVGNFMAMKRADKAWTIVGIFIIQLLVRFFLLEVWGDVLTRGNIEIENDWLWTYLAAYMQDKGSMNLGQSLLVLVSMSVFILCLPTWMLLSLVFNWLPSILKLKVIRISLN